MDSPVPNKTTAVPRKRLFVALMGVTCLLIVGIIYLGWWIPTKGLTNIHPDLPSYVGFVFAMGPLPARSNARGPAMLARGRDRPGYVKSPAIRTPPGLLYSALRCPA